MAANLFYEVNTNLLTSASDYQDLADALRQAAINLNFTDRDKEEVEKAIIATEMDTQPSQCPTIESPVCDSGHTFNLFYDNLENPSTSNRTHGPVSGTVDEFYYPASDNPYDINTDYATSGIHNFWAYNINETSDFAIAMTSDVVVPDSAAYLHFNHAHDFEISNSRLWHYDGGVIEYSTDSGVNWHDAGILIIDNGYTGTIANKWRNPLSDRKAFTGNSNGYISTRLDLSSLKGKKSSFSISCWH